MTIREEGIYHIYNRDNNKQRIFFTDSNYKYFIGKCFKYLRPVCEIYAWCLMPNHFHFLIEVSNKSMVLVKAGNISMPAITNGFRLLQSSYAKGINRQEERSGNLFQQKTKAKLVTGEMNYSKVAFHYIHQNPVVAGMVRNPEDWRYSSMRDYSTMEIENKSLCNKSKAVETLELNHLDLKVDRMKTITIEEIGKIY